MKLWLLFWWFCPHDYLIWKTLNHRCSSSKLFSVLRKFSHLLFCEDIKPRPSGRSKFYGPPKKNLPQTARIFWVLRADAKTTRSYFLRTHIFLCSSSLSSGFPQLLLPWMGVLLTEGDCSSVGLAALTF